VVLLDANSSASTHLARSPVIVTKGID